MLLLFYPLYSQQIDSLEQLLETSLSKQQRMEVLDKLIWHYAENNSDKAIEFNDKARRLAETLKENKTEWLSKIDYHYGVVYRTKGDYEASREHFLKCKEANKNIKDKEQEANILYQLAVLDNNQGNYETSMSGYIESYELFVILKDTSNMAKVLDGISDVYHGMWKNDLSLQKRKEAMLLYEEIDDKRGLQRIYQNMGSSYGRVGELDSATVYFEKAEQLILENNDQQGLGYLYENLGTIYAMKGDFSKCKDYMKKSLEIREAIGNKMELITSYEKYGDVLGFNNEVEKGIPYLYKALELAQKGGFAPAEEKVHRTFIRNYKKLGNYELALEHAQKARKLKDSLVNARTTLQINELNTKYETAEKEKEIIQLNADNKIKDNRNFWMTLGLVTALLFLGIILYFLRQRQKSNYLLAKQNTIISQALEDKNILLKEIHHRVKNNLQVISSLLSLQSRHIKDEKAVEAINEGRARVRSMALIHQNLYQKNNLTNIGTKKYFEQLTQELFDTYKIDKGSVELKLGIEELALDVDTMIPLGLIVNELVTNSLKYAFKGRKKGVISVSLSKNNSKLLLEVKDDGIGIADEINVGKSSSFGYKLIHAFVKKMKADLKVNSTNGTAVSLAFDNTQLAS